MDVIDNIAFISLFSPSCQRRAHRGIFLLFYVKSSSQPMFNSFDVDLKAGVGDIQNI